MPGSLLKKFSFKWPSRNRLDDYLAIHIDEKEDSGDSSSSQHGDYRTQKGQIRQFPSLVQLITVALFVALSIVSALYIHLRIQMTPPGAINCGGTLAAAHARGCTFDQLSKLWLPPACPRFGLDEYLEAGSTAANSTTGEWRYYHDREKTLEMSVDELAHMAVLPPDDEENKWWSTGSEHMIHCTWILLRLAHVYSNGQRKDSLVSNFHHTKHCALFLMDRALESPKANDIRTVGNVGFGRC